MPELARFYENAIRMHFNDHPLPHFHVEYTGAEALFKIGTFSTLRGGLPPRARSLVTEWAALRQAELLEAWGRTRRLESPGRVPPLA